MAGQGIAQCPAGSSDDIEDARRQTSLGQYLGQFQRQQRGIAGRLEHDRVPGHQRRQTFPGGNGDREVPGRNRGDDTYRLLQDEHPAAMVARQNVALDPPPLPGEPLDIGGGVIDLRTRFGERLALLGGQQHRERLAMRADGVAPALQYRRPVPGRPRRPGRTTSAARRRAAHR